MPQSIGTSGIRHSGHAAATMPARADAGDTDGGGREPRKYPRSRYRPDGTRRRTNGELAARAEARSYRGDNRRGDDK